MYSKSLSMNKIVDTEYVNMLYKMVFYCYHG